MIFGAYQMALVVENLPANAGNLRGMGWIPGLGRCPGGGNGDSRVGHQSLTCLRIPRTEKPGGLQSLGLQRVGQD